MSELDEKRRKYFLENIENTQVIITCTEEINIENLEFFSYNVINGKIYLNDNNRKIEEEEQNGKI